MGNGVPYIDKSNMNKIFLNLLIFKPFLTLFLVLIFKYICTDFSIQMYWLHQYKRYDTLFLY